MNNPASSFRVEPRSRWYRDRWPWLLIAGPSLVVIASLVSAWIAVRSDDGLVAKDYYKQGLLINQLIQRTPAHADPMIRAALHFGDGEIHARIEGDDNPSATLRLTIAYPSAAVSKRIVTLRRSPAGDYVGVAPAQSAARRIVSLESAGWRLPTTTAAAAINDIDLTSAASP